MSWQEELRKLDEELASGRLSADDYRVRRDQVLSSAVAQGEPAAGQPQAQQPPAAQAQSQPSQPQSQPQQYPQSQPQAHPQAQSQPSQPQQPPQQQAQPSQPQQPQQAADSTQVIAPISPAQGFPQQQTPPQQSNPEATQVVSSPQQQNWNAQRPADPESTQFVSQQPQQQLSPAQRFQQNHAMQQGYGGQQPWNAPDADVSPPWGGSDLPPIAPPDSSDWVKQGPEVFDDDSKKGGKGKIFAIIGAVVLLAGIAFGAFMLFGQGDEGGGNTDPTAAPQQPGGEEKPAEPASPPDPLPAAQLPGKPEAHPEVKTFEQVPSLNYLNSDELTAFQAAKPTDTKFLVQHMQNGSKAILLLTKVGDKTAAAEQVQKLTDIQLGNGARPMTNAPTGINATEIDIKGTQPAQVRGHYLSGDTLVRIEVISENGLAPAQSDFREVAQAQQAVMPAQ